MSNRPLHEHLLGGIAASSATCVTNPAEVVKTRFQLQGQQGNGSPKPYRGFSQAIFAIAKHEGITGLQRGLAASMAYQFVMNGLRFGVYQSMVKHGLIHKSDGTVSMPKSMFYGGLAGALAACVGNPLYLVKTRMQASSSTSHLVVGDQHRYPNFVQGLVDVYRRSGVFGLWRGAHASVIRVSAGSAAQLSIFSKSKDVIARHTRWQHDSHQVAFFGSLTSGAFVVTVTHPFDLICTRIFNQKGALVATNTGKSYKGIVDCFCSILRTEGVLGFYSGFWAGYVRLAPHTFLCLFFWDELRLLAARLAST